jgi:hypothetical protein
MQPYATPLFQRYVMRCLVPIPKELAENLKKAKETGIGYQVVSVELTDGRRFEQVLTSTALSKFEGIERFLLDLMILRRCESITSVGISEVGRMHREVAWPICSRFDGEPILRDSLL